MHEEHPLIQELASLRNAVALYQHETHASGLKLQRLSLDTSTALARLNAVQAENALLREEIAVYRVHPDASSQPASATAVQELTLALRRLSDKLDATDEALLQRNQELANVRAERDRSKHAADNAFALAARLRAEVEAAHIVERELRARVKAAEEERAISDLAVEEYADLVRSMEGRHSGVGERNSVDGLASARLGLQRLLEESNVDSEKQHGEISRLHGLYEASQASLEAERQTASESQRKLAQAELELQRVRSDDKAAAKMVSRYMKFSQTTTDMLHTTMENLKHRHAATLATAQERVRQAEERLVVEKSQSERFRHALDELTEDISREAYGRRREVSLRLALMNREERLSENVRRWSLKARESVQKSNSICEACSSVVAKVLEGADLILQNLEDDDANTLGSEGRIAATQSSISSLVAELQKETDRRLFLERQFAIADMQPLKAPIPPSVKTSAKDTMGITSPPSPAPPSVSTPSSSTLQSSPSSASPSDSTYGQSANEEIEDLPKNKIVFPTVIVSEPSAPEISVLARKSEDSMDLPKEPPPTHQDPPPQVLPKEDGDQNALPRSLETSAEEDCTKSVEIGAPASPGIESTPELIPSDSSANDQTKGNSPAKVSFTPVPRPDDEDILPVSSGLSEISADEKSQMDDSNDVDKLPALADGSISTQTAVDEDEIVGNVNSPDETSHLDSALQNLLDQLRTIENRYDGLQRSFRDCHVSLEQVKKDVNDGELNESALTQTLRVAVQRLDDYCEDARVELEIRVADEERIAKGYETLLSVPGALSEEVNGGEVSHQIESFLDGTDPAVRKSLDLLQHKLEDLQHDIAKVKNVMHEIKAGPDESELELPEEKAKPASPSGWTSWTSSILSHSRPSSPAPTFGSVVTSPHLRHSSSFQRRNLEQTSQDPFENLGLRIRMPSRKAAPPPPMANDMHNRAAPRPRVSSTMFSIGIGGGNNGPFGLSSRKPSFGPAFSSSSNPPSPGFVSASSSRSMDDDIE